MESIVAAGGDTQPDREVLDETTAIKPTLILLPLFVPQAKLFGGQYAFFEAQTLGMDEPPDLDTIDLRDG